MDDENGILMHRTIKSEDVLEYASGIPKRDVLLTKEEDIEYRSGALYHSSGKTHIKMLGIGDQGNEDFSRINPLANTPQKQKADEPHAREYDDSIKLNRFSADGYYSLDLAYCHNVPKISARKHRSLQQSTRTVQSTLMAQINQSMY